jgi:arylsulfatase A-like enzyme
MKWIRLFLITLACCIASDLFAQTFPAPLTAGIGGTVVAGWAAGTRTADRVATLKDTPSDTKPAKSSRRPNILVLMGDHVQGALLDRESQCQTPNLDRLAAQGVKFSRCYTPNGMCSPARASLMTATYPSTHGVWDCTHVQKKGWVDVSPKLTHWAQRLVKAGYRTGYFGKWHVTQSEEIKPYGWQEYNIKTGRFMDTEISGTKIISRKEGYRDLTMAVVPQNGGDEPHHPAFDQGVDFIRRHAASDEPFCCFVSTAEPGGSTPPKRFFDLYDVEVTRVSPTLRDDLTGKSEIQHRMQAVWKDIDDDDWRKVTTCYLAEMTFVDSEVGRILQTLRETKCWENTIVVYLSDHGQMLGAHGINGLGVGLGYEETYRIPLVIRLPDWLENKGRSGLAREIDDAMVNLMDVGPTLLDLCGLEPLPDSQGRSLRPLIEGTSKKNEWQEAYGEFFSQRFMYSQRIVWRNDWKYIFSPGGVDELYNLADDPHEEHNLAADPKHHDILIDMVKRMWRNMAKIGDSTLLNTHYNTLRTAPIGPNSR